MLTEVVKIPKRKPKELCALCGKELRNGQFMELDDHDKIMRVCFGCYERDVKGSELGKVKKGEEQDKQDSMKWPWSLRNP